MRPSSFCSSMLVIVTLGAVSLRAQEGPPPLGPTPGISALNLANRLDRAARDTPDRVASLLLRFDGTQATTALIKKNPQAFFTAVRANNKAFKKVARSGKPVTVPAEVGRLFVTGDWDASGYDRRAACDGSLRPGFYEVVFMRGSDTTDQERDDFICYVAQLPLPEEDLDAWLASIDPDAVGDFNLCASASGNAADGPFWQCVVSAGIAIPELSREMVKRLSKG